jgi:hypothetical protein
MAILQALSAALARSAGRLLNTAFGWATVMELAAYRAQRPPPEPRTWVERTLVPLAAGLLRQALASPRIRPRLERALGRVLDRVAPEPAAESAARRPDAA